MLMELVSEYVERDYEIIDRYVGVIRENKNKIAIGCLVQWYEIKLIEEYLQSLKNALDQIDNKKNVVVDILFNLNQELEKVDTEKSSISDIRKEFYKILSKLFGYDDHYDDCMDYNINLKVHDINGGDGASVHNS